MKKNSTRKRKTAKEMEDNNVDADSDTLSQQPVCEKTEQLDKSNDLTSSIEDTNESITYIDDKKDDIDPEDLLSNIPKDVVTVSKTGQASAVEKKVSKVDAHQPPMPTLKRFGGKRKYKCIVCSKVFANMRNLKRHQVNHSADHSVGKYKCPACDMQFSQSNEFNSHIKLHELEGIHFLSCSECSKRFTLEEDLAKHKESECPKVKKHKCPQCDLTFRCKSELAAHELTHTGTKPFKCSVCSKAFSRKQILKEHFRLHSGECPYKCDECPEAFRFRSGLNFHKNKVHLEDRPHKCPRCNKTFAVLATLHGHMRLHTGEKPYLCPICGRGFAQSGTLQLHLTTHNKDRPYKCANCEKSFKRADILQRHMLTHTGERPYKCPKCDLLYRDRRSLNKHLVSHTDARPHVCANCGKTFRHKVNLQDHVRLHTGEKAHRCDLCGKAFALQRYLKKHLQVHAKDSFRPRGETREKVCTKEAREKTSDDQHGQEDPVVAVQQRKEIQSEKQKGVPEGQNSTTNEIVDVGLSLRPLDLHQQEQEEEQEPSNRQLHPNHQHQHPTHQQQPGHQQQHSHQPQSGHILQPSHQPQPGLQQQPGQQQQLSYQQHPSQQDQLSHQPQPSHHQPPSQQDQLSHQHQPSHHQHPSHQQQQQQQQQQQPNHQQQQQRQPSQHFQPSSQLDETLLSEFQNVPSNFHSSVQSRPQCLAMTSEFQYVSSAGNGEVVTTVDLGVDPRGLPYHSSSFPSQHTPLPHMSEAFNETLNLKMEKYADNMYTEMTVREGQMQEQLGSSAMGSGLGEQGVGTFPYPGLMMPTHGAFLSQRVPTDQPLPSLYPRHHLDHGQDQEYH